MTSANDTPNADFDERLIKAFESALSEGEEIVARETGDQGQAIALTKTRILVAKAGFAATGEIDGQRLSGFDLSAVTSVNLRKGPLGAVIQICADNNGASAQGGTPDNVVVFTGPGRVKKAEAFAAQVETLAGKEVKRIPVGKPVLNAPGPQEAAPAEETTEAAEPTAEATPEPPKGGRKPKSLAEEIYEETVEAEGAPATSDTQAPEEAPQVQAAEAETEPVKEVAEPEPEEEEPAPHLQYNPNPRLPKPVRKQKRGPNGILVLLGITAGLALIGMAIMAPVRQAQNDNLLSEKLTSGGGRQAIMTQLDRVSDYRAKVTALVSEALTEAASMRSAVASGNKAAARSIGQASRTDKVLSKISSLSAPPGLAEAKETLASGLLAQKTAIAAAAAAAQSSEPLPAKDVTARLNEASAQIKRGLTVINKAEADLKQQLSPPAEAKPEP